MPRNVEFFIEMSRPKVSNVMGCLCVAGKSLTTCFLPADTIRFGKKLKLADLGAAANANWRGKYTNNQGTLGYAAPETEEGDYEKADIFSFGRVLYEMLVGKLPDDKMNLSWYHKKPPIFEYQEVGLSLKVFIDKLQHNKKDERPTAADALVEFENLFAKYLRRK